MSYENAVSTRLLATNCAICGRPLVDSASVEAGVGPDCRAKHGIDSIPEALRAEANGLIYKAAIAAQEGRVEEVRKIAITLRALGLIAIADKVDERFVGVERLVEIAITAVKLKDADYLRVTTPYRRGAAEAFKDAWRAIPGRKWFDGANHVPVAQGVALYALLREFFHGKFATGPKGIFRIPKPETAKAE